MTSPWDDEDVVQHHLDVCACTHSRDVHDETRCWACHIIRPQILAPAYPDHRFHMVQPWNPVAQTSQELATYQPPRGWDRPSSTRQS